MKDLLVISYAFAPMIHAASQRALKFVRYLPENGYRPFVVTVRKAPFSLGRTDRSMLSKLPRSVSIYRTSVLESLAFRAIPNKWLFVPDYSIGWRPFAINKSLNVIKEHDIKGIFAVSPPYTSILAGASVKRKSGLPFVADLSDPWVENPHVSYPTDLHRMLDQRLEKHVVKRADKVLVVSEEIKKTMERKYRDRDKFVVSPLAFDPRDYVRGSVTKGGPMKISYVGSLYGDLFTPKYFLQALSELIENGDIGKDDIEITFVGKYFRGARRFLDEFRNRYGNINITGTIERVSLMEIIRKTRTGRIAHPRDIPEAKKHILGLLNEFRRGGLKRKDVKRRIGTYSARKQTGLLAKMFDELGRK
jgi:hypothetical protein